MRYATAASPDGAVVLSAKTREIAYFQTHLRGMAVG
jgi:hypothetical protein